MMGLSEGFAVSITARYPDTESVTERFSYMAGWPVPCILTHEAKLPSLTPSIRMCEIFQTSGVSSHVLVVQQQATALDSSSMVLIYGPHLWWQGR